MPALKFPDESRATIVFTVLALVAVVLLFGKVPVTSELAKSIGNEAISAIPIPLSFVCPFASVMTILSLVGDVINS